MRTRKRFGQHFLNDANVIRKIIEAMAPLPSERFVEIGPGRGALTVPLLATGVHLDVIEIDRDLARELPERIATVPGAAARCTIHGADALRFDFRTLTRPGGRLRLAGNLPYNISTPLLFHLLAQGPVFTDLHVMLQKEVGERITAQHGSKTYGRLTVALALRAVVQRLFAISPGSFNPPPQVDSVFLRVIPHATPLADPATLFAADALIARAFTLRRKRLTNGLKGLMTADEIAAAGLDGALRPENLPPADWLRLARLAVVATPALAKGATALPE